MKRKVGRLAQYDDHMGNLMVASLAMQGASYSEAFDKITGDKTPNFREWPDEELAELIARDGRTAAAKLAESEVRKRESWKTPALWTLIVAGCSLLVSVIAVTLSAVALVRPF